MNGVVLKCVAGVFAVRAQDGAVYNCVGRGKLKREKEICAGDHVEFSAQDNGGVIEKLLPRRNFLLRPPVANVDQVLIMIASEPTPDFLLIDKIILYAVRCSLPVILCVNKSDLNQETFYETVRTDYESAVEHLLSISARTGAGLSDLLALLNGRISCFAGQSAVGKSSLSNALTQSADREIGEISAKSGRGKHTTRLSELLELKGGGFIADTPGFSFFNVFEGLPPEELSGYWSDFALVAESCRFRGCAHVNEPGCAVKTAVENGSLSADRYQRYLELYAECKKKWENRF